MYAHRHEVFGCWNDLSTHVRLINELCVGWPDGWALSASAVSLAQILPECPDEVHVGVWCKSFASFKPGVNPGYAWDPVIFCGGRTNRSRDERTVRDFIVEPIVVKKGLTGAKPPKVCRWIADMLGYVEGDVLTDIFPGTGVMERVLAQGVLALPTWRRLPD
jgi:hypothetical protein